MTQQEKGIAMAGAEDGKRLPMTYAPVSAPQNVPPFLKQVNRFEFLKEYAEYWWVGARTYMIKTVVFIALGALVAQVTPLGSLLFFALAGRCHFKSWLFNFVVNNPGRSLILVK